MQSAHANQKDLKPNDYLDEEIDPAMFKGGPAMFRGGPAMSRGGTAMFRGGPAMFWDDQEWFSPRILTKDCWRYENVEVNTILKT